MSSISRCCDTASAARSVPDRHLQQAVLGLGRDLPRRRCRRRDDRPARPPRRDPRPQRRFRPPQRPRSRPPAGRPNPRNGLTDQLRRSRASAQNALTTVGLSANAPATHRTGTLRPTGFAGPASPKINKKGGPTFDRRKGVNLRPALTSTKSAADGSSPGVGSLSGRSSRRLASWCQYQRRRSRGATSSALSRGSRAGAREWLDAGQAMERVLLRACAHGLTASTSTSRSRRRRCGQGCGRDRAR
jgi:hypothetical protein